MGIVKVVLSAFKHKKVDVGSKKEILYEGVYYDVSQWVKNHPGGGVIELYTATGEDATLAVQQFHHRSSKKVLAIMKSLPHREINEEDFQLLKMDSEKEQRHKALTADFLKLYHEIEEEGLFKPNPLHVICRLSEIFILCAFGVYFIRTEHQILLRKIIGIFFLALGFGRSGWVMHEGGHHSLFGSLKWDQRINHFFFGIFMGLSGSYWHFEHSRHHANPQHIKHDIDLDTDPLIVFHKDVIKNPKHGKILTVQNQKWMFIPLTCFFIMLSWKFARHPYYCIRKGRYSDFVYMILHYIIFIGCVGFANYWMAMYFTSIYLFMSIILSHTHLPVTEEPAHWVEYSLTHTANIRSSWWVDYWMGNLNYQIEHHLFPQMPQYRNKLCRDRVKALAKKHNLPYHLYSYAEAVQKSLDNLGVVSKELAMN